MIMNSLVHWILRNRLSVMGLMIFILAMGAWSLNHIPVDAVPDITNVQVVVSTKTGALDPEKIEMLITRPIETEMAGLPGLEEVRSISKYGLSQVTLVFTEKTSVYTARQQVFERLSNTRKSLPDLVHPELAPVTTGLGEVFMYSVECEETSPLGRMSKDKQLTELRTYQDYVIRPQLKRIPGVADVDSNGGYQKEIHINFNPAVLEKYGLAPEVLVSRLRSLGESFGGGYIERGDQQIIVRTVPHFKTLAELREISVGVTVQGVPLRLSQVADVREDHTLRLGAATLNGKETVLGTLLMRTGANSRQVADEAEKQIQKIDLPQGIKIKPLYSRSFLVKETLQTVKRSLVEGAVLVMLVLVVMLGHWRAAIVVTLAIPSSMLIAAWGMSAFGISANLMSLGAIDFGLIVDGSVVLIENILRRLTEKNRALASESSSLLSHSFTPAVLPSHPEKNIYQKESLDSSIKDMESSMQTRTSLVSLSTRLKRQWITEATVEVIRPIGFGMGMIMLVYIPILTLEGIEGKMFRPMALTVIMALGASLFVTFFMMPILADLFFTVTSLEKYQESRGFLQLKKVYTSLLLFFVQRKFVLYGAVIGLFIMGLGLSSRLGINFIPKLDEGDLVINFTRDASQGISASVRDQQQIEKVIMAFPEVKTVFSRLGTPESATDPMSANQADTFIILEKDRKQWKHLTKDSLFEDIRKTLFTQGIVQDISPNQPIEMRFNEILEGSRADVTLRILGSDLKVLMSAADQAKGVIEEIPGISSVVFDALTALRSSAVLDIALDYNQLSKYNISPLKLNESVELAMGGAEVGSFFEMNQRFPIVVHLDESLRNDLGVIGNIPMGLPEGGTLPLHRLARLSLNNHVTTIARYWGQRYAAVSVSLQEGYDLLSIVNEAKSRIEHQIKLPEGYQFYWGGQFKNLSQAKARLLVIVPLTLVVVFIILLKSFGNLRHALLVFSTVPFAGLGGVLALWFRGLHLSLSASIGFIALIGIALLNGIVLVTAFNQLQKEDEMVFLHDSNCPIEKRNLALLGLIKHGALLRLKPVLMTALVAGLGFLPMAINQGIGSEVQKPLATVVMGGLVSSTFLTLILIPQLYLYIEAHRKIIK